MMVDITQRQRQVAALVAEGHTNKRIAAELGISQRRVQSLIARIADTLGAESDRDDRVQIALWWTREQRKAG